MMFNPTWMRRFSLATGISLLTATSVMAGGCGYDYCWGAVGVGPNGLVARASGFRTAPGAMERAEHVCGGKCTHVDVFVNGCGAMAEDAEQIVFSGAAETQDGAIAEAMELCGADSKSCRLRVWACTR